MTPSSQIAHYRLGAKLGEGGMGAVYRATDTKLGRDVAIKVLPESFAADPDRMARFTREAQVLASLNHPNIAQIYGIEDRAIVMELVDGPDLQTPLPLATALDYAGQIASALDAAHEKGITHRDLKPANIKVTQQGALKVLDFGLAKIADPTGASGSPASSPTLTMRASEAGMILGTASYMAPEQARGQAVDKRADIWAFGVVLWEMLAGRRMFEGETISDVLASVLKNEPDLDAVPAEVRPVLAACLEKDPRKRLRDIGDWKRLLASAPAAPTPDAATPHAALSKTNPIPWAIAGILALAAAALAFFHFRETPPAAPVIRTSILPPQGQEFQFGNNLSNSGPPAISPDGRRIVFRANDGKQGRLWVRSLETGYAAPIPNTEGAIHPFWSPDSRTIAFFSEQGIRRVEAAGGPVTTIRSTRAGGRGGTWNQNGVILFGGQSLLTVPASGGAEAVVKTVRVPARWPSFLPDGKHFLFASTGTIRVGSLEPENGLEDGKTLVQTTSNAIYADGYVLYLRDNLLMAQPFDLKRLDFSGPAVPVMEDVSSVGNLRRGIFDASPGGLLVFLSGAERGTPGQLAWLDRRGKTLGTLGEKGSFMATLSPSPDFRRVATTMLDDSGNLDIWIVDTERGARTRFTFDPGPDGTPTWSSDGKWLYWRTVRNDIVGVYRRPSDGSGSEELLFKEPSYPSVITPDGKWLMAVNFTVGAKLYSLTGDGRAYSLHLGPSAPQFAQIYIHGLSPDGRWLLYNTNESGREELYVTRFNGPDAPLSAKRQISTQGGVNGHWRADGKEIVYYSRESQSIMSVEVKIGDAAIESGAPVQLFKCPPNFVPSFVLSPDGSRILALMTEEAKVNPAPLTLLQNWPATLRH
jgi:serine/threonine protein kinase